jgi:dihydroorotate dehydrogenase
MRHFLAALAYAGVRQSALSGYGLYARLSGKPMDLEPVIHWGDRMLARISPLAVDLLVVSVPPQLQTEVLGLSFRSPLVASSFKDDPRMLLFWHSLGLGAVIYKTILMEKRVGNPQPRIQDLGDQGLINAMGLPGSGVAALLADIHAKRNPVFEVAGPLGVSVGGENPAEYRAVFDALNGALSRSDVFFEVNISCPNTNEGQSLLAHPALLGELLAYMRQRTDRVIGVKLSPDQSDDSLRQFGEILKSVPRVYVNLGNTQYRGCATVGLPKEALSRGGGGLSGNLLFPRTLEMLAVLRPFVVPMMATGGISTPERAVAAIEAGASLLGMATTLVKNPFVVPRMLTAIS